MNSINISGIVIQDKRCETTAILDATVVSLPYALGITIVLSPNGIAREQTAQITNVSRDFGSGIIINSTMNKIGNATSRTMVTTHTPTLVNTFLRLVPATVMPVKSIAMGDIQSPAVVITEVVQLGSLIPEIPMIIPKIIAMNMGFTKAFSFCERVLLDPSEISREGTPHR